MSAKEIWKIVEANWGWFIAAIVTIQGFVEKFGKLTKKPLASLLAYIGGLLNADISKAQKELRQDIETFKEEVSNNEQLQWRYQIIDFASRCNSSSVTRDQYSYILSLIDKYNAKFTHNGELKLSVGIIEKEYENFRKREEENK